jgi:sporulation protein YhbH
MEKIKRRQSRRRADPEFTKDERFPFHEEDLRYRHIREEKRRQTNAVVFCIMDTSGSMDHTKKYLARSFYFLLYQYLRLKYTEVEVVFVAHTTTAREVREEEFFHRVESGGTFISSGYRKALEIIEERFNPAVWNIYAFHTSDGDNWSEDNELALAAVKELCEVCNLFGYGEIDPDGFHITSPISRLFQDTLAEKNFAMVKITDKEDLFPAMKKLLTLEERLEE